MIFDRDVIKGVLEVYFTEHLVEELLKDMTKSQHEVNVMRKNRNREFVERYVNRKTPEANLRLNSLYGASDSMKVGDGE